MNFTREPIIETVISPREGYKLVLRNSKHPTPQEFSVEAIEVVSFGHSFFYRSLERPSSFLIPVNDYEVLEEKEARMPLRNLPAEKSIKIGGGRKAAEVAEEPAPSSGVEEEKQRRESRRNRRRRGRDRRVEPSGEVSPAEEGEALPPVEEHSSGEEAGEVPAPYISRLFPPPSTLIRDHISRYKTEESAPEGRESGEEETEL